jgi:hypothetical protein
VRFIPICLCLIVAASGQASAENSITFYRDGALIRQEAVAVKGALEIPLATDLLERTLTVIPAAGTTILGVETRKNSSGGGGKELETLAEQRRRLEDRLQALDTREAIFTAAAKAQSGKAPRKTKANPDPMQAIRQGTDFAIDQLEAVYTARRKTTQELRKLYDRLAAARKGNRTTGSSLLVTVTPPRGAVTVRYATTESGWQPRYNLYLADGKQARMQLSAQITGNGHGYRVQVSSGSLAESTGAETLTPLTGGKALLATYLLPLTEERSAKGVFNRFSAMITNSGSQYLPPGETGLFRNGSYVGSFRFEGLSSGRGRVVSMGN